MVGIYDKDRNIQTFNSFHSNSLLAVKKDNNFVL